VVVAAEDGASGAPALREAAAGECLEAALADEPRNRADEDGSLEAVLADELRDRADEDGNLEAALADELRDAAAADRRLGAVLAAAGADELVRTLPGGLGADVGERGGRLSGGQRQRVALARALAVDAPVLVLHDPTTAVDAVTEARVAEGVRALRRGRTTLLVCSSPALLAACDRVVLLEGDEPALSGTHHELAADPRYREVVLT
jgi:putative ABC transport system ATP-binding protein